MSGLVVGIHTATAAGEAMAPQVSARLETGRGIAGDRYYLGGGTFSEKLRGKPDVELTLIEIEEIDFFNTSEGLALEPGSFRRNIVTRGVRLNDLVGRTFSVGSAVLEGIRLCEPCAHLAKVVTPKVLPALVHRAGLRARIVAGAVVQAGDPISVRSAV